MSIVFLLVIIGVIIAGIFLMGFIWSVKSGQYEDSYSPSVRILFDDYKSDKEMEDKPKDKEPESNKNNNKVTN